MVNEVPECCPRCGTALSPVDPPTVQCCPACESPVFHNPAPAARLAVLAAGSVLLVKVAGTDRDPWGTPGGMVGPGQPRRSRPSGTGRPTSWPTPTSGC